MLCEEVVRGADLLVLDVGVRGKPGSQVVEVYLDSPEALSVETLAKISRELGYLLDSEEVFSGAYRLDVSSPGADQPLRYPAQFAKHRGRDLELRLRGVTTELVCGRLTDSDQEGITIETDRGTRRVEHKDIIEGKVKLPW
jgi:ribosome maturation factor RimP